MNNIIAVVLYNKEFSSSLTLNNLLHITLNNTHLVIINNGPNEIKFDSLYYELKSKFTSVTYLEYLENRSLAVIYNTIINNYNEYDRFILFDDDTNISDLFFQDMQNYYNVDVMLQIPRIIDSERKLIH
ncbi:hypothetical protein ELK83_26010, partial [Klebsiella pneumoniae]|nr:hypothetical protein [Klebsiella pneumoniae]